jgi:sec-independent protein translocase protein TatB
MFDISFVEIALVLVIALLVLGPERLPRAAKMVGLWVRRAKASWFSVKAEFERELADEELKRSLQQAQRDINEAKKDFEAATREPVDAVGEVGKATGEATRSLTQSLDSRAAEPAPDAASQPDVAPAPKLAESGRTPPSTETGADQGDAVQGPSTDRSEDTGKPGP